eukprot:SAG11_NODE_38214_length_253_cov_0.675325_1_plen_59_part_10
MEAAAPQVVWLDGGGLAMTKSSSIAPGQTKSPRRQRFDQNTAYLHGEHGHRRLGSPSLV